MHRHDTSSLKWDRWRDRDVVPMWVADMDEAAPPCVLEALRGRLDHGVLGYTRTPDGFAPALRGWLARRHGWEVAPEAILPSPGMVVSLEQASRALGAGDGLVLTPVYPPIRKAPGHGGQRAVEIQVQDGRIDWPALEAAARQARTLWLCSPHNPTGRVWTRDELERLAGLVLQHDLRVVSDEAWMDLVLEPGCRHIPFASLSPAIAARTITILAPSKTFNIPGLSCAAVVIDDPALRRAYAAVDTGLIPHVNALGLIAAEAAWTQGDAWLDDVRLRLRRNRDRVHAAVNALPGLASRLPEATYLTWIDCRGRGWPRPEEIFLQHGLGLSEGVHFGAPGFVRLNFACDEATLDEGLRRLAGATT